MVTHQAVLRILADGKYYSGTALGQALQISRAAVWKAIQKLSQELEIEVFAVKGKGYRLARAIELLDTEQILSALSPAAQQALRKIEVLLRIDSTNQYLLQQTMPQINNGQVVVAEKQLAGRGRRGRRWVSPFGGNLYFSIAWRFAQGLAQLAGLSLAIAVALVRVLHRLGIEDVGVKWPNDVYWHDRKLAGILLEMRGEAGGPTTVIIGIGVNVMLDVEQAQHIDQPWVDLETILGRIPSRNQLLAELLSELVMVLQSLPQRHAEILAEWQTLDVLHNQEVEVTLADQIIRGRAMGINTDGSLRVEHNGEMIVCHSGEVSLRRA